MRFFCFNGVFVYDLRSVFYLQVVESGSKNIEVAVLRQGSHSETLAKEVVEGVVQAIERAREEDLDDDEEKVADDNED